MATKQITDGHPDGTIIGNFATDKLGFYGAAPVVQAALTCIATGCAAAGIITKFNLLMKDYKARGFSS